MADSSSGIINAIDKESVHKICSGQVITTLSTAVKELIENSIDAGATIIDVKFKDKGLKSFSVMDNGDGIEEENFDSIALKHHTSKISKFSDLTSVDTFGFRGEALSSICGVSDFSMTTRHKSVSIGAKIEFGRDGRIKKKTKVSCQKGTTVLIENIFTNLPVRRKEFERNIAKKDFPDTLNKIVEYGIILDKKITVTNTTGKGKTDRLLNVSGGEDVKSNVSQIFGIEQIKNIIPFIQKPPSDEVLEEYGIKNEKDHSDFIINGYISSPDHGKGRSSPDRQFFYVNNRPCDMKKLSKLVNEIYHTFNKQQYPFLVLNIRLSKDSVDINVTPDKRQLMLNNEKYLLSIVKTSLLEFLTPRSSIYTLRSNPSTPRFSSTPRHRSQSKPLLESLSNSPILPSNSQSRTPSSNSFAKILQTSLAKASKQQPNITSFLRALSSDEESEELLPKKRRIEDPEGCNDKESKINNKVEESVKKDKSPEVSKKIEGNDVHMESADKKDKAPFVEKNVEMVVSTKQPEPKKTTTEQKQKEIVKLSNSETSTTKPTNLLLTHDEVKQQQQPEKVPSKPPKTMSDICQSFTKSLTKNNKKSPKQSPKEKEKDSSIKTPSPTLTKTKKKTKSSPRDSTVLDTSLDVCKNLRVQVPCHFSMNLLKESFKNREEIRNRSNKWDKNFSSSISPQSNQQAEEELRREIKKENFQEMKVLGQFNLGFIITELNRDLFIVDQHASDEKYNFERLQATTILESQPLIIPQHLKLTPVNESILLENIRIFESNGFRFEVDEYEQPGCQTKLINCPTSKNWEFGKEDIEELIYILADSPGVMCRPSRIRKMLASRACRSSIMIGRALSMAKMRKLIDNMGKIDQPWNCPHGRPTMRHLINLDSVCQIQAANSQISRTLRGNAIVDVNETKKVRNRRLANPFKTLFSWYNNLEPDTIIIQEAKNPVESYLQAAMLHQPPPQSENAGNISSSTVTSSTTTPSDSSTTTTTTTTLLKKKKKKKKMIKKEDEKCKRKKKHYSTTDDSS
ncbi:DgyrCDS11924 [Dimorphilus gyrociliatus]|uniref:DgyrCDS11924 n=1 Tax=Dimorphilus gyrociliatus TaxID=2664684 RepID=A0A7I8W7E6_9ANNE|nr:DgyrCDS11924 [Dimorphilus gyrociliatus]